MSRVRSLIEAPEEWLLEERHKVGPFVTRERYRLPDGSAGTWSSRRSRKLGRPKERREAIARPWWQPTRLGWWIAVLDPHDVAWKIVALNLAGSIALQISAIAAFIRPSTGELVNVPVANLGTLVGAVGFFLGALLLIPEMSDR